MTIRIKKGKNRYKHKPDTLTCIRDDGSVTWTHIYPAFVLHDLSHYVVEKTLGFKDAFLGLVSKGYNIPEFSLPKSNRSFEIPDEAISVEPIVALLQMEHWDSFPEKLINIESAELPPHITFEQIDNMRKKLNELVQQWEDLLPGETLELEY
ncbi:hypothetical protein JT359_07160 [Candidatus Poribacteria bacterium]|nr:hypothetical protein [Candidatus Poribacteria bacterium]